MFGISQVIVASHSNRRDSINSGMFMKLKRKENILKIR